MNIQLQKLEIIEMLLDVQNESVLEDIKKIISKNNLKQENRIIKELLDYSEQEYKEGKQKVLKLFCKNLKKNILVNEDCLDFYC